MPRILDLLEKLELKATFFVIARDAESGARLWREATRRGHEIASHSVTHPIPFATLPAHEIRQQLRESRQRLEQVIAGPVVGFRAPGWDVDDATLDLIAEAGYRYDASVLPSPALFAGALLRFVLSGGRKRLAAPSRQLRMALCARRPGRVGSNGGLWEFPVAVSPVMRLPFTHTLWYLLPRGVCWRTYRAIRQSGIPLCYQLHAADLLDLHGDRIDVRLRRHPGMRLGLNQKLALLEGILEEIGRAYKVMTYAEAVSYLSGIESLPTPSKSAPGSGAEGRYGR